MQDVFSLGTACPVCGHPSCWAHTINLPPEAYDLTHAKDRVNRPHVIAPEDVWTAVSEYGGRQRIIAAGDPVDLDVAARLGWLDTVAPKGPGIPRPKRRQAPTPRITVD